MKKEFGDLTIHGIEEGYIIEFSQNYIQNNKITIAVLEEMLNYCKLQSYSMEYFEEKFRKLGYQLLQSDEKNFTIMFDRTNEKK